MEEILMIGSIAIIMVVALLFGILVGCFGLRVYALLPVAIVAFMITLIIGVGMFTHMGIAHIGAIAETLGIAYVSTLTVFEIGYLAGHFLLYGAPRSLHDVRPWLHI